ncbi:PREDICTED: GDSL esterase/lipase At5g14450 [Tarenaya hassleriana]|uniref:GDSL esterase/lipase At5g14450 n=1 Tax=Tarenaya hassleriana TaxID=28532 RepID=UPI00053C104B|nr:PREDICTED: GDSL esterase/lipase At5g14450 [Tarenaya hassleriana]
MRHRVIERALVCCAVVSWLSSQTVAGEKPACSFPAIYNFGDSNSDTGGISAAFEPIRSPYGQSFFREPSGRDSDGRLTIDFIAERLGLPYLSAYLNSLGANFRNGANFATGGSTIRRQNETIFQYGISPFSLDMQVVQFDQFKARSAQLLSQSKSRAERDKLPRQEDFSKALYTFDIGQNDISVGFRTMSFDQLKATLPDIVSQFASAVRSIYERGGRSFWVHNTGPFGCLPVNMFYMGNPPPGYLDEHGCVKAQNQMSMEFNRLLKEAVIKLRSELTEAAITYVDVYSAKYEMISNPKSRGFADPLKVCCGYHEKFDHIWCGNKGKVNSTEIYGGSCPKPAAAVSWDGVHYTEAANKYVADRTLNGSLTDPPVPVTRACHRQ